MQNTFLSDEDKGVKITIFENFGLCQFLLIFRFFARRGLMRQNFQNRISPSERGENSTYPIKILLSSVAYKWGKNGEIILKRNFLPIRMVLEEF